MNQRPADPEGIEIGDRVRSLDFPDYSGMPPRNTRCYVEGVVRDIKEMGGCWHYEIEVTKEVWQGASSGVRRPVVYPPVNGQSTSAGGVTNGVVKIGAPAGRGRYGSQDDCCCGARSVYGCGRGHPGHADYCPWSPRGTGS